jgi:hypothetical protein
VGSSPRTKRGPWRGIDEVEYATLEWVDWFNHRRLLEPIGYVPPAEFEAAFHRQEDPSHPARPKQPRPPMNLGRFRASVLGAETGRDEMST